MNFRVSLFPWQFAFAVAVFIVFLNNSAFFAALLEAVDIGSANGAAFALGVITLMVFLLSLLLLAVGIGPALRALAVALLVGSAALGYFVNEMGVVFDAHMLANIADTVRERNVAEARELASPPLLLHILLHGALPSVLVILVRLRRRRPLLELRDRLVVLAVGMLAVVGLLLGNYRYAAMVAVEHRDLRYSATPVHALVTLAGQARHALRGEPEFRALETDTARRTHVPRRLVGIMVVGETARADHFSLNGYPRHTNPVLENEDGLLFLEADACGTSTAYSVPCIFFLRGSENYSPAVAGSETNVLDLLAASGINTVWLDNNSSCKHVCDRIESRNLRRGVDGFVREDGDYDIALVAEARRYIDASDADLLLVLHMMGSHGPAYSQRYPANAAVFTPYCDRPSPKECSPDEVGNAYDNTILYTDYVIGELIELLRQRGDALDSFLLYASDHGESLGENGIYLHGLPYAIAPSAQKTVPFVLWMSPEYTVDTASRFNEAFARHERRPSHDNIPSTLLGLFGIDSQWYQPEADLLFHARAAGPGGLAARTM